jgi:arabinan endo-1,5-alpha-L-arabinosidase
METRVSLDLRKWTKQAPVFAALPTWARAKVPGATGFWAPDISFRDGTYWLYYSVSTLGSRRSVIGLATNTTLDAADPAFRWVDRGLVWETTDADNYNAIDPNSIVAPDGKVYLAFGSYWSGLKAIALDRVTGKPTAGAAPQPLASRPGADAIEGACIVRRGAYHYLFCSHDFTGRGLESTYKVVVGRASSPLGPFADRAGKPMLEGGGTTVVASDPYWRGPGHNAVLQDGDKWWLVYHALDPQHNAALKLRIDPLRWTADGWPEVEKPAAPVYGWWEHRVADGPPVLVHLLPGGKVNTPEDPAGWTLTGSTLEMRWPNPAAPGGAFVDRCTVSADRRAYAGRNQAGVVIRGRLSVLGWWEHRVADGAATMIRLLPGGKISDPGGSATWKLTDDTLELRWPNASAPGGAWVDTVRLLPDRSAYDGKNQSGLRLTGRHVASE